MSVGVTTLSAPWTSTRGPLRASNNEEPNWDKQSWNCSGFFFFASLGGLRWIGLGRLGHGLVPQPDHLIHCTDIKQAMLGKLGLQQQGRRILRQVRLGQMIADDCQARAKGIDEPGIGRSGLTGIRWGQGARTTI